jgi:hypothetical protein
MASDTDNFLLLPDDQTGTRAFGPGLNIDPGLAPPSQAQPAGASPKAPPPNPAAKSDQDWVAKALNYDKDKDPEYLASKAQHDQGMDDLHSSYDRQRQDAQAIRDMGPPPDQDHFKQAVPVMQDYAVKGMPFLLMAMALGGKAAKLSGGNMLAGMTGMMQGAQEGSMEKFNNAYKTWQENYKQFDEEQKNRMAIYKANLDWRKDAINAEDVAAREALSYVGASEINMKNAIAAHNAQEKAALQIEQMNAKTSRLAQSVSEQGQKLGQKFYEDWRKETANTPRAVLGAASAIQATQRLPEVLEVIKSNHIPYPKSLAEWKTLNLDGIPENQKRAVQEFVAAASDEKIVAVAAELNGTGKGNMLTQMLAGNTSPEIWKQSPAQIQMLQANLTRLLKEISKEKIGNLDSARNNALSKDPSLSIPDYATPLRQQIENVENNYQPSASGGSSPKRFKVDANGNPVSGY